ncbi:RDD family protein [Bacillus cereus]
MHHELAGFWRRFGASVLDKLVFVPFFIIFMFVGMSLDTAEGIIGILTLLYGLIVPVIWLGFTVGKKAVNVRIVRVDGQKITIWTTVKRYILSGIIYGSTFGIALIVSAFMVALRKDTRSIHDLIAGTQVICD